MLVIIPLSGLDLLICFTQKGANKFAPFCIKSISVIIEIGIF